MAGDVLQAKESLQYELAGPSARGAWAQLTSSTGGAGLSWSAAAFCSCSSCSSDRSIAGAGACAAAA